MDVPLLCQYDSRVKRLLPIDVILGGPFVLGAWLRWRGLTNTDFASRCDVSPSAVVRWLDGSRVPRRVVRARIEALTDGLVSRFLWLTPEEIVLEKRREEFMARTAAPRPELPAVQTMATKGWEQ